MRRLLAVTVGCLFLSSAGCGRAEATASVRHCQLQVFVMNSPCKTFTVLGKTLPGSRTSSPWLKFHVSELGAADKLTLVCHNLTDSTTEVPVTFDEPLSPEQRMSCTGIVPHGNDFAGSLYTVKSRIGGETGHNDPDPLFDLQTVPGWKASIGGKPLSLTNGLTPVSPLGDWILAAKADLLEGSTEKEVGGDTSSRSASGSATPCSPHRGPEARPGR